MGAEALGCFFGTFVIPDRLINTDWMKRDWVNPVCLVWAKSQQRDGECATCVVGLCCVFDVGVKASAKLISKVSILLHQHCLKKLCITNLAH